MDPLCLCFLRYWSCYWTRYTWGHYDSKDQDELLELPLPTEIENQKQCCTPGGTTEISATIEDLKEAAVVIPRPYLTQSSGLCRRGVDLGELLWTIVNSDSSCSYYFKCGIFLGASLRWPLVLGIQPLTWPKLCLQTHLKDRQKQSAFTWQGQQYPFVVSHQGCQHCSLPWSGLQRWRPLDFSQNARVAHCINDVMLIVSDEEELARTLDTLVRNMWTRRWALNSISDTNSLPLVIHLGDRNHTNNLTDKIQQKESRAIHKGLAIQKG